MKAMLVPAIVCCLILLGGTLKAQIQNPSLIPFSSKFVLPSFTHSQDTFTLSSPSVSCLLQKNSMPFFCRLEHRFFTQTNVKLSFRLGSLDYSNQLEYGADRFRSLR
ncbi:MAG: hypothetical protein WAT21_05300 [Saprospiraceae bacterium]|nr:hypothetical protein [Candidatus Vicinibacter affinis]HQX44563.1 hypothetical protein [Saprospiraceae bacterium]